MKKARFSKTISRILLLVSMTLIFSTLLNACELSQLLSFSGEDEKKPDVKFVGVEGGYAVSRFKGTSGVKKYVVPDEFDGEKVIKLAPFSIANAEYLEVLSIGPNISEIDIYALTNCPSLKTINVDAENPKFKDVKGVLYSKDGQTLLVFPNKNTENMVIEDGVVNIGENAFYKCSNLKTISFPASLKTVGDRAFIKCRGLVKVDLPDGLETIGEDSFSFLHAAEYIYVPATVKSIGNYGFFDASKVPSIKMGHKSADELETGKDWHQKKDVKIATGTPIEWGAQR